MITLRNFIRSALILSILLLPLAHLKLHIFGIPLYSIELPILLACIAYGYGWRKKILLPARINFRSHFFIGSMLFFGGAVLSFVANPFSLTGLGMLKTWFFFPLLFTWLWVEMAPNNDDVKYILLAWLSTTVIGSLVSMIYFIGGVLTYDGRLAGWYTSPNYLAFFLAPGIVLTFYFSVHPFFVNKKKYQYLFYIAFVPLLVALFLTHSYGVWMGIVIASLVLLFLDKTIAVSWRKQWVATGIFAILCGAFIFFESGSVKWQTLALLEERSSFASRMMIWKVALRGIAEHPIFGIGIGRFQEVYLSYQQYFPPYLEWAVPEPHNLYFSLWLETGIIGLLGFMYLVGAWCIKIINIVFSHASGTTQSTATLLTALLVLPLIIGFIDTPFFKTDLIFMFWCSVALGIGVFNTSGTNTQGS